MVVTHIFLRHMTSDDEKVPIIKNLLGKEEMQILKTLTEGEQEICENIWGLFDSLCE